MTIKINCPNSYLERYGVSFANWGPSGSDVRHSGFEIIHLPDADSWEDECFELNEEFNGAPGFYWWSCDTPEGPFDTREEAIVDARGLDLY